MKRIILFIFCFFTTTFAIAQTPAFQWAKSMGGSSVEAGFSLALDASGNIYTTGWFQGTVDFDPGSGIFNLTSTGWEDGFISKSDASGNFLWAKNIGGILDDGGSSIAVSVSGGVYLTGWFTGSVDFDPGIGTFNITGPGSANNSEIFVLKLDASGNFVWAKNMGGSNEDFGSSIALDASDNIYTTGRFRGIADFDPGAGTFNLISAGSNDIFISKLNASGNFVWAKNMGGIYNDYGYDIAVDANNNVYNIGIFKDTADLDPGVGTFILTSAGSNDICISKLDATGNFLWAKSMGGAGIDNGVSIEVDKLGNVFALSHFDGLVDFDPGIGTFNLNSANNPDISILKLNASGNFVWAKNIGGHSYTYGASIELDAMDNVYITGSFWDTVDFDPGPGIYNLISSGSADMFISKLDASSNFVWAKSLGETQGDGGYSIAVDGSCNVYITGAFQGTADFNPDTGICNLTAAGSEDIFILKMSQSPCESPCNSITVNQQVNVLTGNNYTLPQGTIINTSGLYTDTLSRVQGCDSIIITNLEVIPTIPNVFTPNNDKENDIFRINLEDMNSNTGAIFDRWGIKINSWDTGSDSGWNGNDKNGNKVQEGTYYYLINVLLNNGDKKEYKGIVTLLR